MLFSSAREKICKRTGRRSSDPMRTARMVSPTGKEGEPSTPVNEEIVDGRMTADNKRAFECVK